MIDLIIPYYNNVEGLERTLQSILFPDIFYITLIDDHSSIFPKIFPNKVDQVYRYNLNRGPGYARQYGIDKTHNEWLMFIDTGDVFIGRTSFDCIMRAIKEHADADVISFPYIYKGAIVNEQSNRMHGKIYKRAFLEKYSITFAPESSYLNEDIGFNRTCRLCTDIVYENIPIISWIQEENSLTQKDNGVALYAGQTRALSLVSIHTIETLRRNNISDESEINQIALSLYYWIVRTAAERPQFLQEAWTGARIFYNYFSKDIDPQKLLLGNAYMKKCLQYRGKVKFQINVLRFAHDIQEFEIIPDNYLT